MTRECDGGKRPGLTTSEREEPMIVRDGATNENADAWAWPDRAVEQHREYRVAAG
jgi:hypothetical protein